MDGIGISKKVWNQGNSTVNKAFSGLIARQRLHDQLTMKYAGAGLF
jgi:hypothetical protein